MITKEIAQALFNAQKGMESAKKEGTNPHFKSKYAKIENVLEACEPALNDNGIMLMQPTGKDALGHYVETTLIHVETGQSLSSRIYLAANSDSDMQKLLAAITYARRGSLVSLFALTEEDDDGETVVGRGATTTLKSIPTGQNELTKQIASLPADKRALAMNYLEKAGSDPVALTKLQNRINELKKESM